MPHRNRSNSTRTPRENDQSVEDDNEDCLLVADTLEVNRSTARGIKLFTDTAAILNLLDLRSIMGCPGGHSLSIYARFWAKREPRMISREKGDHYYILTWHNYLFFPLQSLYRKTYRKIGPKSARKY